MRVLLLHGIWMRGFTLGRLDARLRRAGFVPERLDYASVRGGAEGAIAALRERLARADAPLHLVGHSLGGLVAAEAARGLGPARIGRVLCLGSPLAGSAVARRLGRGRWLRWATGRSAGLLEHGIAPWAEPVALGSLAGTAPVGFGAWFGVLDGPHDGTVALAETRVEGLAAAGRVHTTHTGLILSRAAAEAAVAFLREGRFPPGVADG